jgi:hypothetical protein
LELADTEYLYNLDEVLVAKSNEEIIAKLRELYDGDVFDDCMNGFPGLVRAPRSAPARPTLRKAAVAEEDDAVPMGDEAESEAPRPIVRPQATIAKPKLGAAAAPVAKPAAVPVRAVAAIPRVPKPAPAPVEEADEDDALPRDEDPESLPPNPMSAKRAAAFLSEE